MTLRLAWLCFTLMFGVIVLGAYVRLSDAGLGCPDWPGCYGRLLVPSVEQALSDDHAGLKDRPLEAGKAWREMLHRYAAATLGLLIVALAIGAARARKPQAIPFALVGLVVFQAMLGMWTVTLLLKPLVVVAHLLGGITLLVLLWWWLLRQGAVGLFTVTDFQVGGALKPLAVVAFALVYAQIFLGGWTSANYAALACADFPTCQGAGWPNMDFDEAFVLWRGLGQNYEYGVLDTPARTAIHFSHRLGALLVAVVLSLLAFRSWKTGDSAFRLAALFIFIALAVQVSLGIANVTRGLPLATAAAHNGVGTLLLLAVTALLHLSSAKPTQT